MNDFSHSILASRRHLLADLPVNRRGEEAAEGGCGVLGFAANIPVAGRHVLAASRQMHNRGNGKGGGIAMAGLSPVPAQVDAETLASHYLLQIALLDPSAKAEVEANFIFPYFEVAQAYELEHLPDYRMVPELDVRPPDVWRYFVRVKPSVLADFSNLHRLEGLAERAIEDEFVYQNSFLLNRQFYASLGKQRAFVLSHARNLSVLKIVGYAEQVVSYYCLEDQTAQVWIAHQRYPTKGRVWHPGGAHPFIGLNEALVHNGDFANYHAVSEYLRQRNIGQLFLTDTEVSVQLFDLWDRVYRYPLEITLEAMAPTSEFDFSMLPPEKQAVYRAVQQTHIHGSPDGPWFFIVARTLEENGQTALELLGITDTSMLRPQVFASYENNAPGGSGVQIGLVASERQAINACLRSLASEDERFQPHADRYWAARGGSHTDGGAFRLRAAPASSEHPYGSLVCTNKFAQPVRLSGQDHEQVDRQELDPQNADPILKKAWEGNALIAYDDGGAPTFWNWLAPHLPQLSWDDLAWGLDWMVSFARNGAGEWEFSRKSLTLMRDRHVPTGNKARASLISLVDETLITVFGLACALDAAGKNVLLEMRRLTWRERGKLRPPRQGEAILVLDASDFPPEGDESAARILVRAYELGWRKVIAHSWQGGRFAGCGLGENSVALQVHLYGDVGDYAGSGLDGAEIHLHGDAQDQVGQILKCGRLVIYGDVGQTFLYGAKGGEIYVLGSAAGRPLINAVGRPRVVINGTCLDYLAESFMAGDPLQGGGFAIINGVSFDEDGRLIDLDTPYPGGNLFSLASGGAIYLRDPGRKVAEEQLNGGAFTTFTSADWALIQPYLQENERLFGVRLGDLLQVEGVDMLPEQVYRKVTVKTSDFL